MINEFCQALHWKNVFHEKKNKTSGLFFICVFYLNLTEIMRFFFIIVYSKCTFSLGNVDFQVFDIIRRLFSLCSYIFLILIFFLLNFCYFFLNSALRELIT